MYAVVQTGGKQYRVAIGDKLKVEKLEVEEGASVELSDVLMVSNDGKIEMGEPLLKGTSVGATVLAQGRGEKIKVFKFKRRKKYRKTQGHRQSFTQLEITSIGSAKTSKAAPKKAAPEKAAAKADAKPAAAKPVKVKPTPAKAAPKKAAASKGKGDNLTDINGIGPVIEQKLKDMDITTFQQIADFSAEQIADVDGKLNFKGRIEREEWVAQAKKLAS